MIYDIPNQLDTGILHKLEGCASLYLFGDDMDFLPSQWSKSEALWTKSATPK